MSAQPPPPPLQPESSVVAHVVVVGFHAQLGNRIEFAYPRLRGDPVLRSPKLTDTTDISADATTPSIVRRNTPTVHRRFDIDEPFPDSPSQSSQPDWGILPDEWSFLPFMALPDGVHDQTQDLVFFTLPPDVHCVACFRQVLANTAKTHSASTGRSYERGVAARGSVQKSVVLLCRRPFFGVLADRLVPAVRAYFEQADFANTQVLSSLFHSLNVSLARPSLASADTLFHGLDLRALVRRLGPQLLAVLKLIMLESRIVVYSQPVRHASNAVIALSSIFAGALDAIAPTLRPLDSSPQPDVLGLPLSLFGPHDRVVLQPYAPLPFVSELIPNFRRNGCVIGTSHNVGLLLSSAASAHARKASAARRASAPPQPSPLDMTRAALQNALANVAPEQVTLLPPVPSSRASPAPSPPLQSSSSSQSSLPPLGGTQSKSSVSASTTPSRKSSASPSQSRQSAGGVPLVDALINLSTGKVSVSAVLEPQCRVTKVEKIFMRDLVTAASRSAASVSSSGSTGPFIGSDDYIRSRLRLYMTRFLQSVASVDGILGGPVGGETWSSEMLDDFEFSPLDVYNEQFVRRWMMTRNAAEWARKCSLQNSAVLSPPQPEFEVSNGFDALGADRLGTGPGGWRQNVADLGKLSSFVSARAAEGLSSLFKRIEHEVAKMDTAVGEASGPTYVAPPARPPSNGPQIVNSKERGDLKGQEPSR